MQSNLMLANLTIRCWSGQKHDKSVTAEVDSAHGSHGAGRYNKQLVDKSAIKSVRECANKIRAEHYRLTLPWADDGPRVLPSAAYFDYQSKIPAMIRDFEQAAGDFRARWSPYDEQGRLNGLWNREDFPTDLSKLFGAEVHFAPMPSGEDFRCNVPDADMIRADIEAQTSAAVAKAAADVWSRFHKVLASMVAKLSDSKAIFRDSLVNNVRDLCDLAPALNILDDPALSAIIIDAKSQLLRHTPSDLRDSGHERAATAESAKALLDRVSSYMECPNNDDNRTSGAVDSQSTNQSTNQFAVLGSIGA